MTTIFVGNNDRKAQGGITVNTIEKALKFCEDIRSRGDGQPISVKVFAGVYELSDTLLITPEITDVSIETFSGKTDVIISGAKAARGKECVYNGVKCLCFYNPDNASDFYTESGRATPTRFPESGYFKFFGAQNDGIMFDDISKWVVLNVDDVKELSREEVESATLNFLHYWVDEHTKIERFDEPETEEERAWLASRDFSCGVDDAYTGA